jgi:Lar family restriction alleviation protein
MEYLKPCPFCGGKPYITDEDCFGFTNDEQLICCDECGLQFGFSKQYDKEEVIELWNNRSFHVL